jgi:hypothetical protein
MPKWLQVLLGILVNVGSAYIAVRFPQYLPVVAAGAGAAGLPLTLHAYNTNPVKAAVKEVEVAKIEAKETK